MYRIDGLCTHFTRLTIVALGIPKIVKHLFHSMVVSFDTFAAGKVNLLESAVMLTPFLYPNFRFYPYLKRLVCRYGCMD